MKKPNDNEISIWEIKAECEPDKISYFLNILSIDEKNIAANIANESQRNLFITSHAATRCLLSHYLKLPTTEIDIAIHENGKPYIKNTHRIHFNLSHTQGIALFGLSTTESIGLDIEHIKPERNILGVAKRFFNALEYQWIQEEEKDKQLNLFYQLWCLKEACLKGVGCGLQGGLNSFAIKKEHVCNGGNTQVHNSTWHFQPINISNQYKAAIAHQHSAFKYQLLHWDNTIITS